MRVHQGILVAFIFVIVFAVGFFLDVTHLPSVQLSAAPSSNAFEEHQKGAVNTSCAFPLNLPKAILEPISLESIPPTSRVDIFGDTPYSESYDVLENVCLDGKTGTLYSTDPELVGAPVSRQYKGRALTDIRNADTSDIYMVKGTTIHLMFAHTGNVGHLLTDVVWPHIAVAAWRSSFTPPLTLERATFLVQGMSRAVEGHPVDELDGVGCATFPFHPWTRNTFGDYAAKTLITAANVSDARLLFDHLLPPLVCFERFESARDASDRFLRGPGDAFHERGFLLYRRSVLDYLLPGTADTLTSRLRTGDGPLRVLAYDRRDASSRHLTNVDELMDAVGRAADPTEIDASVIHDMASLTFPEQTFHFMNADVLIMPHGAHLANAWMAQRFTACVEFNSVCESRRRSWLPIFADIIHMHHTWTYAVCENGYGPMIGNKYVTEERIRNATVVCRESE